MGVSLLGTEGLTGGFHFEGPDGLVLFPSDHYGVRGELQFVPDGWANPEAEAIIKRNIVSNDFDEEPPKAQRKYSKNKEEKKKGEDDEDEIEVEGGGFSAGDPVVSGVVAVKPPKEVATALREAIEKADSQLATRATTPHLALLSGLLKESYLVDQLPFILSTALGEFDSFVIRLDKFVLVDDGSEGDLCVTIRTAPVGDEAQLEGESEGGAQEMEVLKAVLEAGLPVLGNTHNATGSPCLCVCSVKAQEKDHVREIVESIQKEWKGASFVVEGVRLLTMTAPGTYAEKGVVQFRETEEDIQNRRAKATEKEREREKEKGKEKDKEKEKVKEVKEKEKGKAKEKEKEKEKEGEKETAKEPQREKQARVVPASGSIEDVLSALHLYPSAEDNARREEAIATLENLCDAVLRSEKSNQSSQKSVFTLGSYRLGVHSSTSDIDALCISYLTSKEFFDRFQEHVQRTGGAGKGKLPIKIINIAAEALVPILQLDVGGIQVFYFLICFVVLA